MCLSIITSSETVFKGFSIFFTFCYLRTLVLWGEDDKLDPPETARLLYEALSCKKQLHIIAGNGHVGHLDRNKDQVFALTADWVLRTLL